MEEDTGDSAGMSESVFFSKVSSLRPAAGTPDQASKTLLFPPDVFRQTFLLTTVFQFLSLSCPLVLNQVCLFHICPENFLTLSQNTP